MNDYAAYVGMDAHARSIMCRGMREQAGEPYTRLFESCPTAVEAHGWLATLPQPTHSAYESGCTGFWLARDLRGLGDDRGVIATSTLPRSAKDKQGKCGKLDAKVIPREILNPMSDRSRVWVPDAETEAARDLARARQDAAKAVKGRDAPPEVKAIASKANTRPRKRYRHLIDDSGKSANKAKAAVVSELVRWIWAIGLRVRAELAPWRPIPR